MPLIRQSKIMRADLKSNPDVLYLFGDNRTRQGMGGQAKEMRGEPNAVGIATKHRPDMMPESFYDDVDYDKLEKVMYADRQPARTAVLAGRVVVLPLDGLGTGLSKMPTRSPKLYNALTGMLHELELMDRTFKLRMAR